MNATELLADVKRKAQIAADEETLSDSDILDIATKELQTVITPKILSVRENFFATYHDFTLSNTRIYRIPSQATGSKILGLEVVDGEQRRTLIQINMFETQREGFFIRSGSVNLSTNAPTSGTLRLHYSARPGVLTETVNAIQSRDSSDTITLSSVHGLDIGSVVSIQRATSPFEYVYQDIVVSAVPDLDTVTFSGVDFVANSVGLGDVMTITSVDDGVAATGSVSLSYYPQIPVEMHDWLSYRVAIRCLEHIGHSDLIPDKVQKVADIEKDLLALISPRSDNDGKIIFQKELLGDYW